MVNKGVKRLEGELTKKLDTLAINQKIAASAKTN